MRLRTAKLTLPGGGERICGAEAGRSTKEARRVSLSRFGGLKTGSAKPGSSSVGGLLACEITTLCSRVVVGVTPLLEYPERDGGLLPKTKLPMGG